MRADQFEATYLIETPFAPEKVAEVMAGEQSCGTFVRVHGETDALRKRAAAVIERVEALETVEAPSLPNAWLARRGAPGPWRRARVTLSFPVANVGVNLPTLAATVAGNLFDLGEVTGLRLDRMRVPADYRRHYQMPRQGIAGTRKLTGNSGSPIIGSIIKPNVGLSPADTAGLVRTLCESGIDFIKDDEISANPAHAPLAERVPAVMAVIRAHEDRTGKRVMMAFNITDETDAMRRHADLVAREGGTCVMASLNWCGFSAIETLRRATDLAIHGHRNGYGALSRAPLLGIGFNAYQCLWRLAGVDHMHVHGLAGKFAQEDDEVIESAQDCLTPLTDSIADEVMPAFSSGQWAGTVPKTWDAVRSPDLMFMSGGGIMAHPGGPAAGVASIRDAWEAVAAGRRLDEDARNRPALRAALDFFGRKAG